MLKQRSWVLHRLFSIPSVAILLIGSLLLAGCGLFGGSSPDPVPTTPPTASDTQITLDSPAGGANVRSPLIISGRVTPRPPNNTVSYSVFDLSNTLLARGTIQLQGDPNGPGTFAQPVAYTLEQAGMGRVEVVAINPNSGEVLAIASLNISLSANPGQAGQTTLTPTNAPPQTPIPTIVGSDQTITIETPPPGTTVGSPVVITGRTTQMPANGQLFYLVRDQVGAVIGSGQFGVNSSGSGNSFNASINFNLPAQGGQIEIDLFEPAANGSARARAAILLTVAPPQQITIESPPPGTTVGSPVVITGRTARYPFQGNLAYRFTDNSGQNLGEGIFPVNGNPGGPSNFTASLQFNLPAQGGVVRLEVYDQNAVNNEIVANTSLDLNVLPPSQTITIETPPPGTVVGSPVVLTGRVVRPPVGGQISYLVRGPNGTNIGQGSFGINGTTFNASISFTPPPQGGAITIELRANDSSPTQPPASASISLNVNPTTPPTTSQQITIDSPAPGTAVGSPVVLTGRVARYPFEGNLGYRISSGSGQELGRGTIPVQGGPNSTAIPWVGSLTFSEPAGGGQIIVEVFDQDQGSGAILATATLRLQVNAPPIQPTAPIVIGQEIVIETPTDGTLIGNPVVLTGRAGLRPSDGNLNYRVLTLDGSEIAAGIFPVDPSPRSNTIEWQVSINFPAPRTAQDLIIEISDRPDAADPADDEPNQIAKDSVQVRLN
ncbi:MAG: hypothetical protein HC822_10090 [Oscillochloris sp.]|nr:hypothetical protein [Oscillochloris sp.]